MLNTEYPIILDLWMQMFALWAYAHDNEIVINAG